jgi:ribosomal RNA-processing protein 12
MVSKNNVDALDSGLIQELVNTVLMCMSQKNREVTKASLGFIKIAIVCLKAELLELCLEDIVKTVLDHSQDFKSHFKSKIRHIFERLIRKFSFEQIDQYFPEDHKKLILNIKKRRESLKKRKQSSLNQEAEPPVKPSKKKFEEAFQDSDSELESDNDDYIPDQFKEVRTSKKKGKPMAVIREGEVVDFLDRNVVSQVSHQQKLKKSKINAQFKSNQDGKMVIADSDDERDEQKEVVSEDFYKQSIENELAFTRGPDGRVKFLKRKRNGDVDGADGETTTGHRWNQNGKNKREKAEVDVNKMLGRQYKSKRAKGDVKRAGMPDPHAYIPLEGKIVGNMYYILI